MREAKLWLKALGYLRGTKNEWFFAYWMYDLAEVIYAKATFSGRKP